MADKPKLAEMNISADPEELKGRFSNAAQVSHQADHFLVDFFLVSQPMGQLVSRVGLTPGHTKALRNALNTEIEKFEAKFGEIELLAPDQKIDLKTT